MDNDEKKIVDGEESVSPEEESSSSPVTPSHEGVQSAEATFGAEAARSGIIPGLTDRDVASEVQTAFLDYSMSVIVSRAIPDVRDGLKPVQRRIIYGMNEMGMYPNKPYKKCARIVGDVMGKYHPHGDSALYLTLVRMAQPFSLRYTLVDGHGNFGSIDGDEPAAMRYTEARMNRLALEMVRDIDCDTVNMMGNYDGTELEPEVLPSRFPNLIVNGSQGIAVGMATNMAPHNLRETIDAVVAVAHNPEITPTEIMQNYLFGPDFPSGGVILGRQGILDAYTNGIGTITIRSRYNIEEMDNGKARIIVTEIPYQVNKANLIASIADLVRNKVIDGITDVRDESNKEGMRVVIEVRKDVIPEVVVNNLLKHTSLQTNFGIINLCLEDGAPKTLGIIPLIQNYINFQVDVLTRRTRFFLKRDKDRLHVVEGLILAHDNIDEVIHIIRSSRNDEESTARLFERFGLSEKQCAAILAMTLRRLQGIEQDKLQAEKSELVAAIAEYERLLSSRDNIIELMIEELHEIQRKFGDDRLTEITDDAADIENEDLIPQKHILVMLTKNGYIKRMDDDTFSAQHRGGRGITGMKTNSGDVVSLVKHTFTHTDILFFTTLGKVYRLRGYQIPDSGRTGKGMPAQNFLALDKDEKVVSIVPCDDYPEDNYLLFVSRLGKVKRTSLKEFASIHTNGKKATGLDEGDGLFDVKRTDGKSIVALASSNGKICSFEEGDVRVMGRTAVGVRGMDLSDGSEIIGVTGSFEGQLILVLTSKGYGKMSYAKDTDILLEDGTTRHYDGYRLTSRGAKGVNTIVMNDKIGNLVCAKGVSVEDDLLVVTKKGVIIRTPLAEIKIAGRATQGVKIINLDDRDTVASLAIVPHAEEEELEAEEAETIDETLVEENPATPDTIE
ncbi:MAG: DNA gyrase subunit A [Candidatus Enteromonas sp.]|nr:DNA gyrase subunit A [Candidatus Enteromonas sp.]MDY6094557.1 DNA gyrase subunit A [Candidatus Enteromonas sp.]